MNCNELIKKILANSYNLKKSKTCSKKIRYIAKNLEVNKKNYNKKKVQQHKEKWAILKKNVNSLWYKVYSLVLQREEINFIPEDIYYCIVEPCLNNKQLSKAYADKNSYELFFDSKLFPTTILRNIDGKFYTYDYEFIDISDKTLEKKIESFNKIIIKPSIDSGGGKSVELFINIKGKFFNEYGKELSVNYLEKHFQRNFLIQSYISQHSFFKQFNKESVNTVRIFTYRSVKDDKIIVLHSILRVGRPGRHVDNQAAGGLSCGIDKKGKLNNYAVDKYGNRYTNINGRYLDKETIVPFYSKMVEIACKIAPKHKYSRLLGFDFCVDINNQIKIIEINNVNNEINFYQMNNGSLFQEYTDEIINYCTKNQKSFVLDYYY